MDKNKFAVEVIYALPSEQRLFVVWVDKGSTILDAILQSKILTCYPEIKLEKLKVGIFGKKKGLNTILNSNDRVEIYRPLRCDPKVARRQKIVLLK